MLLPELLALSTAVMTGSPSTVPLQPPELLRIFFPLNALLTSRCLADLLQSD